MINCSLKLFEPNSAQHFCVSAWEARMDSHGRVFYIDHATRTTSWTRPGGGGASLISNGVGAEQQRRQLDRRYQSIRRTISSHQVAEGEQTASVPPGCKLLTRPDFFTILHMNQVRVMRMCRFWCDEFKVVYCNTMQSYKKRPTRLSRECNIETQLLC